MIDNNKDKISIQVGLSGYSFKVQGQEGLRSSGWLSAEQIFSTPDLQKKHDEVSIAVFTHKYTLVPAGFYDSDKAREMLAEVVSLDEDDVIEAVQVPQSAAVLIYSLSSAGTLPKVMTETALRKDGAKAKPLPEAFYMLEQLQDLPEYNKIMASYMDGYVHIVISQGKSLLLCNSYRAVDFTTAEYFIFLAMKKLQLNPEVSSICFRTPLSEEQELSLYRYFRSVERL